MQSVPQIVALTVLRRRRPDLPRPYRQWLCPVPSLIALAGWACRSPAGPGAVMAAEMAEQPDVLARLLDRRDEIEAAMRELAPDRAAGFALLARGIA